MKPPIVILSRKKMYRALRNMLRYGKEIGERDEIRRQRLNQNKGVIQEGGHNIDIWERAFGEK